MKFSSILTKQFSETKVSVRMGRKLTVEGDAQFKQLMKKKLSLPVTLFQL